MRPSLMIGITVPQVFRESRSRLLAAHTKHGASFAIVPSFFSCRCISSSVVLPMHTLPLLRLASTVATGICPCQGFLRQLASGLLGITGVCHSARTLGGTAACHQATAASHAQAVFATQPEHGQRPASFLEDLPKQVDQREYRTYTPTPSQIPFAIATADSGGSKASGSPDGLRTPLTEPMQDRESNQGFASSRCAAAAQEGLFTCEGGKDPDGGCSTDGACSTLPQTQPKGSSFHAKLLRDGTADDTWSVAPNRLMRCC